MFVVGRARQAKSRARENAFYALVDKAKGSAPDAKVCFARLVDSTHSLYVCWQLCLHAALCAHTSYNIPVFAILVRSFSYACAYTTTTTTGSHSS